jgi:hypothetical protein
MCGDLEPQLQTSELLSRVLRGRQSNPVSIGMMNKGDMGNE